MPNSTADTPDKRSSMDYDALTARLSTDDQAERTSVLEQLRAAGNATAPALVRAVHADDGQVNWRAAQLLGRLDSTLWQDLFADLLTHPNALLASVAVESLGTLGVRAIEPLLTALPISNMMVQLRIVTLLGTLGAQSAVSLLCEMLTHTDNPSMRYTIIQALENIGDTSMIPQIAPFVNDSDRHVRKYAQHALETLRSLL